MRQSLFVVALLTLVLGACASAPSPRPDYQGYQKTISPELAAEKACADWRRIAVKSDGAAQCPQVPGWKTKPVFVEQARRVAARRKPDGYAAAALQSGGAGAELRLPVEAVEEELARFCVYESRQADATFPESVAGIEDADKDCAALAPAATWDAFAERLLAEAGKPASPLVIKNHRGVRLAFVDTQKTAAKMPTWPSASPHGYTLAHIARHLVCSPETSQTCAAQITTRLALPIREFDSDRRRGTKVDRKRGGGIGTQTDLANAIVDEIDAWRGELGRPHAPEHLVLNLSLAWDPKLIGQLNAAELAQLSTGTQAVYQALQYARSHDVLVVAAAGNRTECNPDGPLLPAAWEGNPPEGCVGCGPSSPLLYAVGGVRADRISALPNARNGGMPRRAAYGEDAIVSTTRPGHSTWGYTGSSVSTAVVSSIAALVWDSFPTLGPHQVMEILERSGEPVSGLQANFGFASSVPPSTRRISLCRALRAACDAHGSEPGASCPLQDAECDATYVSPAPESIASAALQISQSCYPWLVPQPEDLPCPPCGPPGG